MANYYDTIPVMDFDDVTFCGGIYNILADTLSSLFWIYSIAGKE
jgi:hypothetical protein